MRNVAVDSWLLRQRSRWFLLARLGPRTLIAYGRIARAVLTERLWSVPIRAHGDEERSGAPSRETGGVR